MSGVRRWKTRSTPVPGVAPPSTIVAFLPGAVDRDALGHVEVAVLVVFDGGVLRNRERVVSLPRSMSVTSGCAFDAAIASRSEHRSLSLG